MTSPLLRFADASLTDGQTALWSGAMTTAMAAKLIGEMENAGFSAIEVISSQTVVQCLERGEDPWQRLEVLRYQNKDVPFRACVNLLTEHGCTGADVLSNDVCQRLLVELSNRDISQVLLIDPLLQFDRLAPVFTAAQELGMTPIGVLPFTQDEKLTDAYFAGVAVKLVDLGAERIMLRDESGVLTPDRVAGLVPQLIDVLGGIPLVLHTRCVTGLGPLVAIDAITLGVSELDTALPGLANGPSLPSSKNMTRSLGIVQIKTDSPDMAVIDRADACVRDIAEREDFCPAQPWVFDLAPYMHQLPGDVAAMAMNRLRARGEWHLLHEYSTECARIRAELGAPAMLPPYSRCIAEQAFVNLSGQRRYSEIKPGVRRALQGIYGKSQEAVDSSLVAWVGAVPISSPSSWSELCSQFPQASDRERIIQQLTGVLPDLQARPCKLDDLVYETTTPLEMLRRGMAEYASEYAQLSFTGPDVDLQFPATGVSS